MRNNIHLHRIALACALLLTLSTAHAGVVTTAPETAGLYGSATLNFSADLLGALDTGKVTIRSASPIAVPQVITDPEGFYSSVSVTAPVTSLTYDLGKLDIYGVGTTGGLIMTAPALKSVSSGGSLTVTDLRTDLSTQTIFATVTGSNGAGTINDMALWHFNSLSSQNASNTLTATITGLSITTQGFNAFTQSLGLLSLGKSALSGVTDFGTITSTLKSNVLDAPLPAWQVSSVPEPATYALMGLGLIGLATAQRRHTA